ncbi:MAG: hypothetical protein KTR30_36390, partial [Saprospiraceae bacterium]|nr:hypothetical protein [Saprospiraceae bacterium]
MKRFLLLVALVFGGLSLQAQEIDVPKSQIPLITKISASWCPHCGNWGWNFFEGLLEGNQSKAIMMVTHYSGNYRTSAGEAMANNFGIVGQPEFYMGTEKISANSGNFTNMIPMVSNSINTMTSQAPTAQSALKLGMLPDGSLKVQARAQFFETATGEFYLGIYIVEKDFVGYQSPIGNDAQHKNLFRGSIDNNDFGELLVAGSVDADQVFDIEHSFNLNATGYQSSNIDIVSILWEKVGERYEYVNANSSDVFEIVSANEEVEKRVSRFQVSPNPLRSNAVIELSLDQPLEQVVTDLMTITGEKVQTISTPNFLPAGEHRF